MAKNSVGAWLGPRIIRFRWLVILGTIVTVMATGSGGRFLAFSDDERAFFGKDNPQLIALEQLENTYTKDENVMIAIAPESGNVFNPTTLSIVEELTEWGWQIPFSSRVDSLSNFQNTYAEEDDLIVEDLVKDAENLSPEDLERIKKIALNEPFLKKRTVSTKGHVTGININFLFPGKETMEARPVVLAVRAKVDELRAKYPDHRFYITGGMMISNAFFEASTDDMSTLIPLMLLLMITVMLFALRSLSGTIASVIVIVISTMTAMGLAGWAGILLTPASAMAPTIILTLAIADSIHLLVTAIHEMRMGKPKNEAIIESVRINLQPIFLTSITTAIGFLSMNFSDAPPFHDLGNIVAVGVIAAFFFSAISLPAIISILPFSIKAKKDDDHILLDRVANFVIKNSTKLLWGISLLILLLFAGISRIELNDIYLNYFDTRYAFRTDTDFVKENLTSIDMIEYSIGSGEEGGISNPGYLSKLEEFSTWLNEQPEVMHVIAFTDTMKRLNKNMHGDDEAYYKVPQSRELAAQYLLLYEMSLPFGLDLNNSINVNKSATRLRVLVHDVQNKEIRDLKRRSENWLKNNAPSYMESNGTGINVMFSYITGRNITSMLTGTIFALVLISAILIFAFKSAKIGLISLIPNLVPAGMAFGLWGWTVGQVGLAVSVVAAMSLGIVVDDTVHFLSKYLRAKREHGMDSAEAVRYSFRTVGTALLVTTIILMAGFGFLTLSGFKMNSAMGLLTAISIGFALFIDFYLLPPLLIKLEGKTK